MLREIKTRPSVQLPTASSRPPTHSYSRRSEPAIQICLPATLRGLILWKTMTKMTLLLPFLISFRSSRTSGKNQQMIVIPGTKTTRKLFSDLFIFQKVYSLRWVLQCFTKVELFEAWQGESSNPDCFCCYCEGKIVLQFGDKIQHFCFLRWL